MASNPGAMLFHQVVAVRDKAVETLSNRAFDFHVLSPEEEDADSEVIKAILAITNHPERREEKFHFVAEIHERKNMEPARLVGRDEAELIDTGDVIAEAVEVMRAQLRDYTVEYRAGDTTDRATIESTNPESFEHIIVLCYADRLPVQKADAKTLVTRLHLRDIEMKRGSNQCSIVSEMLDVRNRELAEMGEALGRAAVSIEGGGVFVTGVVGVAHFLFEDGEAARRALEEVGIRVVAVRDGSPDGRPDEKRSRSDPLCSREHVSLL